MNTRVCTVTYSREDAKSRSGYPFPNQCLYVYSISDVMQLASIVCEREQSNSSSGHTSRAPPSGWRVLVFGTSAYVPRLGVLRISILDEWSGFGLRCTLTFLRRGRHRVFCVHFRLLGTPSLCGPRSDLDSSMLWVIFPRCLRTCLAFLRRFLFPRCLGTRLAFLRRFVFSLFTFMTDVAVDILALDITGDRPSLLL